jgi:TIR domain
MTYLKSFDHDVFISYAHVDNLPNREGEKGWVERFAQQLSIRLLKRFGEPVDVWHDPQLRRSQLFDTVIEKAVQGAGVMVSLISNRYLRSDYCQQELKWFCDKVEQEPGGLVVDDYVRVFPVLLYNIPPDNWPDACQGVSAFPFHDARDAEFGEPLEPDSDPFGRQLRRLVDELYAVRTRLGQRETGPESADTDVSQASDFTIFMASPSDDLRPIRRQLTATLEQQGITVVDNIPPPYDAAPHAEAVTQVMQQADLCVHLMSTSPGEPLDPDIPDNTFLLEQTRLGLDHARSQLILAPSEFSIDNIEDASFATFVRQLAERPRDADHLELVRTGRHQMLDEILLKKKKLEALAAQQRIMPTGTGGMAFIDVHINDVINANELVSYLSQKHVVPIMIPSADQTPAVNMSLFEENLKKAQLFIIIFGAVTRNWVEHRLNEAFKLILSHQLSTQIGVYVAPPHKSPAEVKFPVFFHVMVNVDRFDASTLEQLLQQANME